MGDYCGHFNRSNGTLTMTKMQDEDLVRRIRQDLLDSFDEELEMEVEDRAFSSEEAINATDESRAARVNYFRELFRLQGELVKLQDWVVASGHKVVVLFEGRDAAGKGGAIKRITQRLNPRVARVAALPAPNDRERTQWYFQRYVSHLPAAGEIVMFDRSWYNRAGVERVMGFCSDEQYEEHSRFLGRIHDPLKQWKLSPMDLESRKRWEDYTVAKELMLDRTHTPEAPWWIVHAVDKKKARLNCIAHLLAQMPYEEIPHPPVILPARVRHEDYVRQKVAQEMFIPEIY